MRTPPDQAARQRIRSALDENLLVEAGAGSGKTSELVQRMVALVAAGRATVDEIVAVTFTRKAAAELTQRFQQKLEEALRHARAAGEGQTAEKLDRALREFDRGFTGTIHSFCARLLRERPLESGLDPSFREVSGPDELILRRTFWHQYLERLALAGDAILERIDSIGVDQSDLEDCFKIVVEYPEVEFLADEVGRPKPGRVLGELERLVRRARGLVPEEEPARGWDPLQEKVRWLLFSHEVLGWGDERNFFEALQAVVSGSLKYHPSCWPADVKDAARELARSFEAFAAQGGEAHRLLVEWLAHRYPVVLRFVEGAARAFREERVRTGQLTFQDLLVFAAQLLRTRPATRRELGRRYRYLLVDEFQDTDPLQAEVLFLLTADDPEVTDWHRARPRPGALFVVGDPKQSIYRFRRADIDVYNQVRERFQEFGAVVELTANFRSQESIADFVNEVFPGPFPPRPNAHQAAFAPLLPQSDPVETHGVFWYEIECARASQEAVAREDGRRLAAWIEGRVRAGERKPCDFLILTYRKDHLDVYARALEARNIPVQVTGAGVPVEAELRELLLLLRALADPGNEILTVAVLLGLFFGLDYEQLAAHRLEGRDFRFERLPRRPEDDVERALERMHAWWQLARRHPAEVAIGRIVDELGLLPYLAAGELGASSAGALVHLLEHLSRAGIRGQTALAPALELLQAALGDEDAEAPLEPGHGNAVRVMNLHKAKGLEATVVVLACPAGLPEHPPTRRIERPAAGDPVGWLTVDVQERRWRWRTLARPKEWDAHAAEERRYEEAERIRLFYVAATRAKQELVVSRFRKTDKSSPWRSLYGALERRWPRIELPDTPPPARRALELEAPAILERVEEVRRARERLARPGYRLVPVHAVVETGFRRSGAALEELATMARAAQGAARAGPAGRRRNRARETARQTQLSLSFSRAGPVEPRDAALAWGRAVHAALEAAGQDVSGDRLRALCRELLLAEGRSRAADGEPAELEALLATVNRVWNSELGARIRRAERAYFELEFMSPLDSAGEGEPPMIVSGSMDVLFHEPGGWVLADYKTEAGGAGGIDAARLSDYRAQLDVYARSWERLTGEPIRQRILWFTADGSSLIW